METISAVSNTSIPFTHIVRAIYSEGRIAVQVNNPLGGYSSLKHIRGIPSFHNSSSISLTRLKQLDTLIDQISKFKNRDISLDLENKNSLEIENLITGFAGELKSRLGLSSSGYFQGIYEPGSLLNLTA
ncbi:MAG: hypothetical protein RBT69_08835 [Spirochaetia bacterium]|nr:hypothetical protein [Spirochaetia bacterium]